MNIICMILVNITPFYSEQIVTSGRLIYTINENHKVDFYEALSEGQYDMNINSGIKMVPKKDCKELK